MKGLPTPDIKPNQRNRTKKLSHPSHLPREEDDCHEKTESMTLSHPWLKKINMIVMMVPIKIILKFVQWWFSWMVYLCFCICVFVFVFSPKYFNDVRALDKLRCQDAARGPVCLSSYLHSDWNLQLNVIIVRLYYFIILYYFTTKGIFWSLDILRPVRRKYSTISLI